jgi:enhancing lycopene biosynthesis protein 2
MNKFAIILSGCGQHDGSETHETVLTLLSMDQQGVEWDAFAPDIISSRIINHINEEVIADEKRSVLQESARLTRGKIKPLSELNVTDYDAIVFPGGIGAVTVLCDWYNKADEFTFNQELDSVIKTAVKLNTPLGFICIAPMMIAKIYKNAIFTIGNDADLAKAIEKTGNKHENCKASDVVVDTKHKLVSTPANMVAKSIDEVYKGIYKLIQELVTLAGSN